MAVETQGLGPLESYQELTAFARRCGENALRLAMHAAVPQSFRADLLHLLKLNFLPDAVRDPAVEADVLLADFTEDLSGGYYRFDTEVRRQLLDRLDAAHPQPDGSRLQRVARFLAGYVAREEEKLEASADPLRRGFLEIERWVALAHLDPDLAARQLAHALDHAEAGGTAAVRLQLGGLIRSLSAPLSAHPDLLIYAAGLRSLEEGRFREGRQMLQRLGTGDVQIAGVKLRPVDSVLSEWKDRFEPASREDAPAAEESTILIVSESDTDFWTEGRLFQRALNRGFHIKVLSMREVDFTKEADALNFATSQSAGFLILDERFLSLDQDRVSALFGLPDLPVVPVWRPRLARPRARENYLSQRLNFGWWAQPIEISPGEPDLAAFEEQLRAAVTTIRVWMQDPGNAVDVAKQHLQFFQSHLPGSSDNPFERFESLRLAARESIARGHVAEARDLLERTLAALLEVAPVSSVSLQVQTELAQVLVSQGEVERARELMERALSALREPGAIKLPFAAEMQTILEKLTPATSNFDPAVQFAQQAPADPNAGQAGAGHVFIAHSDKDRDVAHHMVAYLESRGIRCWLRNRHLVPGMNWAQEIASAIQACDAVVLILSQAGNDSRGVFDEVNLAGENDKTIIPFRIDTTKPSGAFSFRLAATQQLDASHDWESHLPQLYDLIEASTGRARITPDGADPAPGSPVVVMGVPEDDARARLLASVLDRLGYTVWFDAGRSLEKPKLPSIEQARTVLILWSRNSADNSWLLDSAAEARDRRILIPVLMDDSPLPEVLRNLHAASLLGWSGDAKDPAFENLTRIIRTQTAAYEEPPVEVKKASIGSRIRNWFAGDSARQDVPPEDSRISLIGAKVYVSYRPSDAEAYVYRIRDDLTRNVGRGGEILATDLPAGDPLLKGLEGKVRRCQVMLVLIGKDWLFATDSHGRRRLDNPDDSVRNEIRIALENGLIVIPVLLGGAPFPEPSSLPDPIAKLFEFQGFRLSHEHWERDLRDLTRVITDRSAE